MNNVFNITDFGAIADGITDCTKAIQAALDEAGKVKGSVVVPPGKYLCGYIKVPASVCFEGFHGWGYREVGGSVLVMNDDNAKCMIELTGGHGCMIKSLQLVGNQKGQATHGMMTDWEKYNGNGATFFDGYTTDFREDSFVIDDCQVRDFTGDGIHLSRIFAFTIRNSHIILNNGNGIYIDGWDGWINNCILSFNGRFGLCGEKICASVTTIGNRVEWNRMGGYTIANGGNIIINASSFDRNMGPAIKISSVSEYRSDINITSNNFNRNGKPRKQPFEDEYDSSHIYLTNCRNCIITGNAFRVGIDDGGGGILSPDYGIVYGNLTASVIQCNVLQPGAMKQNIIDISGQNEMIVVKDNVGSEYKE